MLTSKQTTLKPLLESQEGIHLTAYLVNRGDLFDLKFQLRTTINEAYEWLDSAMTTESRKKFLEPLETLLTDVTILKHIKGNIGLFRNEESFRILNIPVSVEQSCQVATSFHVKPLLRWLQTDREFLLLGVDKETAHLYSGNQDSFRLVDSIRFPESFAATEFHSDGAMEADDWLNDWLANITIGSKAKLFLAGESSQVEGLKRVLTYPHLIKAAVTHNFNKENFGEICSSIRSMLMEESKASLEKVLLEFRVAEKRNRAKKNIFQISRAIVAGRVRKLVVTDELNIFGRIDTETGGLAIHPFDLDHEDDDLLDDLAQMVLSQGGEVVVAKRAQIPNGRPILAILDDDGDGLEKTEDVEVLQERSG